jgi:hypothetical protein
MIQDPNSLIATLAATTAIVIVLFFLPALIELRRPKDAGPRLIKDVTTKIRLGSLKLIITDIEEEQKFIYQKTTKIAGCLCTLLDLEV